MTIIQPQPHRMKTHIKYCALVLALLALFTLLPALMFHFFPSSLPRPRITLRQGTFIGLTHSFPSLPRLIDHFLGIPYGESTAGANRFRAPIRVRDGVGVFNASSYGPRCPAGPGPGVYGEDCLRVNVYRPFDLDVDSQTSNGETVREGEKLPVVVHVHGGAFNSGFGNVRDMASFIAHSVTPLIGVSFNYRTGAFGFLPGEAAKKEGALNVGLRDMILALQWVRENIAAFGGDADKVTVMGSSAGAHGIGHLLGFLERDGVGGEELFKRVIMESGAATARAVYPYDHTLHGEQLSAFLKLLGLGDVVEGEIIGKLRDVGVDDLKRASDAIFNWYHPSVRWPFQPVIDGPGGMIEQAPIRRWKDGKWMKVPILTGFNTNEGAMFVPEQISTSAQFTAFFRTLLPGLDEDDLKELEKVYPNPETDPDKRFLETRSGLGKQFKRTEQAYGQFAYVAPVKQTANFASSAGEDVPTYLYHFAVNSSVKGGADHGTETPFVVNDAALRVASRTVQDVAGMMHAYWTSFVATGEPNAVRQGKYRDRPEWKRFVGGEDGELAVFGSGNDELAGGKEKGTAVRIGRDDFAVEGSRYWWARTEKFES